MKLIKKEDFEKFVLYIYDGEADSKTTYRRVLKVLEECNLRKAIGRQEGQHKHRKSD